MACRAELEREIGVCCPGPLINCMDSISYILHVS